EVASFTDQAIAAGRGQPCDLADIVRRQRDAVLDQYLTQSIGLAAAGAAVEKPAGYVGPIDLAGVLVLQLHQATLAAAVAQRLPLGGRHLVESLALPEPPLLHRPLRHPKTPRLQPLVQHLRPRP